MPYQKFVDGILKNSKSANYHKALSEWIFHHKEDHEAKPRKEKCVCTKEDLRYIWYYENQTNNKIISIGSTCVKNFLPNEYKLYEDTELYPYYPEETKIVVDVNNRRPIQVQSSQDLILSDSDRNIRYTRSGYLKDDFVVDDDSEDEYSESDISDEENEYSSSSENSNERERDYDIQHQFEYRKIEDYDKHKYRITWEDTVLELNKALELRDTYRDDINSFTSCGNDLIRISWKQTLEDKSKDLITKYFQQFK